MTGSAPELAIGRDRQIDNASLKAWHWTAEAQKGPEKKRKKEAAVSFEELEAVLRETLQDLAAGCGKSWVCVKDSASVAQQFADEQCSPALDVVIQKLPSPLLFI